MLRLCFAPRSMTAHPSRRHPVLMDAATMLANPNQQIEAGDVLYLAVVVSMMDRVKENV